MANTTGIPLSIDITKLLLDIDSAITQVNDKIRKANVEKIKINADTSELESAIKRIKSEVASITGRSSISKIELGTSRADGQITLDELDAFRKAEEALANPVGMAAVQSEFNKTAEIVKNLITAVSAFKTEYSSIGGVNSAGNTNGLIDVNTISERIKTAVSGLNITKPVEIPIAFKGVREAVAALQQQVDGSSVILGGFVGESASGEVDKTIESIKRENTALQENNELLSKRDKMYKETGDYQTSLKYGTKNNNTTYDFVNGKNTAVTHSVNYEQQRKEMDKTAAAAASLNGELERVKTAYSNLNVPVPIKSEDIVKLDVEYESIKNRINELKSSTAMYNEQAKAEIEEQIKALKQLAGLYREANSGGTSMRKRDIETVKNISSNVLNSLVSGISDSRVLSAVQGDIAGLKQTLDGVTDRAKLNDFLNQFDIFKSKVSAVTTQLKSADGAMDELQKGVTSLNKISSNTALYKNKSAEEIKVLLSSVEQLKCSYQTLMNSLKSDSSPENLAKVREQMTVLKEKTVEMTAESNRLAQSLKQVRIDDNNLKKVNQLIAQMEEYMRRNPSAMAKTNIVTGTTYGNEIQAFISQLRAAGDIGDAELQKIANGFSNIKYQIKAANLEGNTFLGEMKEKATKFIKWTAMTLVITKARMYFNKLFTTVYELDEALIDLRKTFKSSDEELENFYYESNKIAKQLGVTTKEIIAQASAWSRLGFSTKEQASKMAEYSAMFKNISPGMDIDTSTDGLVSVMKAFKIGLDDVDEVVDGIMSKINIVGNTRAVNNTDIVDFLTRSSAAMAEANNTLEDTIALGTAITEITRGASNAGQVLKTVSMRIRGYDESTEDYTNDVEELSGKIADLTKTASTPGGISLFKDADKTIFKSTREILGDISKIYDQLTDKQQAGLLEALAGKRNGQAVAAILTNYEAVEDSLNSMANSVGSAENELKIYQESAAYLYNQFKETFTSIAQNAVKRDDLKNLIKFGTSMLEIVDGIVSKIGLIPTILTTAVGIIASKKTISHNLLGFNLNGNGKMGFNFLGAQVGSGWSAQRATIKAQSAECKAALNDLYAGMVNNDQESAKFQAAFTKAMNSNKTAVQDFALKAKEGTATIRDMTAASTALGGVATKLKGILVGLGNTLLSMGISLAVSALINGIISGIKSIATYEEDLKQAVKEGNKQVKSAKDEVSNYNSELAETRKRIYELEQKSKKGKLSFFEEDELENLKYAERTLDKLLKIAEYNAQKTLDDIAEKAHEKFLLISNEGSVLYDIFHPQTASNRGNLKDIQGFDSIMDLYEIINKFPVEELDKIDAGMRRVFDKDYIALEEFDGSDDAFKLWDLLRGIFGDLESYDDYIKAIKDKMGESYSDWVEMYESLSQSNNKQHQQEAEMLKEQIDRYEKLTVKNFKSFTDIYESGYFSKVISYLNDLAVKGELTGEVLKNATDEDVEGMDEFKKALISIGKTNFDEVVENIERALRDTGAEFESAAKSVKPFKDELDNLADKLDECISKQEKLAEAFKKTQFGGTLNYDEIRELINEMPTIIKYLQETADGWILVSDGISEVNKELAKTESDRLQKEIDKVTSALDTVGKLRALEETARWTSGDPNDIYNSEEYKKLYDEAQKIRSDLKITEGWSVVQSALVDQLNGFMFLQDAVNKKFSEQDEVLSGVKERYSEVKDEISDYNDEIKTIDSAIKKLNEGALLDYEELNELLDIDHDLDFESYEHGYSISIDALEELRKKSYETRNARINDIEAVIQKEIEEANAAKAEYQKILSLQSKHDQWDDAIEGLDSTNTLLEYLYGLLKKINGLKQDITYDADKEDDVSSRLQNEIDYYKTILAAVETMQDKYSEAIDKEIDALKESKDALKETNDERQRELDLIEARNNLENAKKRKVYVYSEGEGFKQVQDEKAVKEAEEKYRNVITDIQEAEIDKQIDALEKQKELFEQQNKDLTELEGNINNAKTVDQALKALGLTDEKELLNLPEDIRESIKTGLADAILQKEAEDNKENTKYVPADLDDVLKSLGATVTAEDLKSVKNDIPTKAAYDAAVKDFVDSLNNFTENAVSSVVNNNGGVVISPTFNIYDANNPEEIAKVVNSEMTNLLTRYNNSIK